MMLLSVTDLIKKKLPANFRVRPQVRGHLTRMVGLTLEAVGLNVAMGETCIVENSDGSQIKAEVIGFSGETVFLMPFERSERLRVGAMVYTEASMNLNADGSRLGSHRVLVGDGLLGRVVDGLGRVLDNLGPLQCTETIAFDAPAINPLHRQPIKQPLDVGIRAINGLLTVGRGQRIGLFAGSGVGKSVLLGMMTKFTEADVVVVSLVGERGREVREFIENTLGKEGLRKAVVVASPADDAPLMRLRASYLATRVAEHFRDQGKHVLLLMDSLTRFAQAQREIALASGEPPATRGYPPSVFAKLPQLVERAGNAVSGQGSLTAIYTVLAEGDDLQDPIVDAARAILDGHIVLSREMAEEGVYPAIDIEASISRVMPVVVDSAGLNRAMQFKKLYNSYRKNRDLINIGAYTQGANVDIDRAIDRYPHCLRFISQPMDQCVNFTQAQHELKQMLLPAPPELAPHIAAQQKLPKALDKKLDSVARG